MLCINVVHSTTQFVSAGSHRITDECTIPTTKKEIPLAKGCKKQNKQNVDLSCLLSIPHQTLYLPLKASPLPSHSQVNQLILTTISTISSHLLTNQIRLFCYSYPPLHLCQIVFYAVHITPFLLLNQSIPVFTSSLFRGKERTIFFFYLLK